MIRIRYTLLLLLSGLFAGTYTAHAQCTTNAGTISGGGLLCEGSPFSINNHGNETLDANDVLIFVAYTGGIPNAATVLATSTDVNFVYQSSFLANSPFQVAAVAGNASGGSVDWDDPCLSVSPPVTVAYLAPPQINTTGGVLNCMTVFVQLVATANQQNCMYLWSNNANTPNTIVQQPGPYCVTVTNPAGCTATECVTVEQDVVIPLASAQGGVLTCNTPSVTLDASGSSQGPDFTYQWSGPGISPANQNQLSPVVNVVGSYTLIVTNVTNGCTSSLVVDVTGAPLPVADAGPDTGIPCGGGQVTLDASGGPNPVVFAWSGPNGFTSAVENPIVSVSGTYTVTVTDVTTGCTATDAATVFPGPAIPPQDFIVTNAACQGVSNGSISLTMSVGQSPYNFAWTGPSGFSASTEDITGLAPGQYSLVATDNSGCSYYANVVVGQTTQIVATAQIQQPTNCLNSGMITVNITGGTPPYLVTWSINGVPGPTGPVIQIVAPAAGVYTATITDANGCTAFLPPIVITQPPQIFISIEELTNFCDNAVLQANVFGGIPPYAYLWNGPNNFTSVHPIINIPAGNDGLYTVTITDAMGCSQSITYSFVFASGSCTYISGHVVRDNSENCIADAGEPTLGGWLVQAANATDTLYGVTNAAGEYLIGVPPGDYTVTAIKPNNLWELCPAGPPVSVTVVGDTVFGGDIPVKKVADCPALTVSIGTNLLRRCFSNNFYFVEYCNEGTAPAEDAYVLVTLDPLISPVFSSIPYSDLGNNVLRFNVGDLDPGDCGFFNVQVMVSCNAVLGQTHCTEAHIFPDSTCLPNDPQWSGASLKVTSLCDGDSVRFFIQNIGTGDMNGPVDYVIIEDAVMLMQAAVGPLASGATAPPIAVPANGSTWQIIVDQVAFHPGNSAPSLAVEGCTNNFAFSTGFVTQFPNDDADPWIDIDCTPNIGSYDPNDKQGFPVGYGPTHYIRPGTELEYLIRFQNTGTDTAFTVRVVDTLSAWLDPTTIRPGAGSHAYTFDLTGAGVASFLFENILLPDSNVNQAGSNGFVKFSIRPKADAPLETVIENDAAIYFDFNDPVITNTTFHRLGENFILSAWRPFVPGAEVKVSPNPFGDAANLEVKGLKNAASLRLRVFDAQGMPVREMESAGAVFRVQRTDWPAGVYFFQVWQEGRMVGTGKMVVK